MSPRPFRKLVNAILVPSGDQAGASLPTTSTAAWRAAPDAAPGRSATAPTTIGTIRRIVHGVSRIRRRRRLRGMFGAVVAIMLAGFITGGLARLAVAGPRPMPL